MSRRKKAKKKDFIQDPKYKSVLITQFINCVMHNGKKSVAQRIFYDALELIHKRLPNEEPIDVFTRAVENVKPMIEVRSKRVGGATYQVPVEVPSDRRTSLAIRWIITAARGRNDKTMVDRLSAELLDASNNRGAAVKKREDTHRMAEANRAFSHYRW